MFMFMFDSFILCVTRSACARGDTLSAGTHCQVANPDALAYLQSEQMLRLNPYPEP